MLRLDIVLQVFGALPYLIPLLDGLRYGKSTPDSVQDY